MVLTSSQIKAFNLWLKRQGVRLEGVKIGCDSYGGLGVYATQLLSERSVLMVIPETAVMSLRNLRCDEVDFLLERDFAPSQVLQMAIAAEIAAGPQSRFYGYIQTLPHPGEDIPMMWDDSHLAWLAGTGLDVAARERRKKLEAAHKEMVTALASDVDMRGGRLAAVTAEELKAAASLTSSRCMYVDDRHGYALVPAADAMNHKCAFAPKRRSTADRDGQDREEAGMDEEEAEDEEAEDEEEEEAEEADTMDNAPGAHRFSGASRTAVLAAAGRLGLDLSMEASFANLERRPFQWDSSDEEEEEEDEEEGEDDDEDEEEEDDEEADGGAPRPVRQCMVVSMRPVPAGAEVHYTYGETGNGSLLGLAGFLLPTNPLTTCTLPWKALREAYTRSGLGGGGGGQQARAAREAAREVALRKAGGWSRLLERSYTFDLTATPPPDLRLLLRLLTAPSLTPWMLAGGGSKQAAEAVRSFQTLPLKEQMPKEASALLEAAVAMHMQSYGASPGANDGAAGGQERRPRKKQKQRGGTSTTSPSTSGGACGGTDSSASTGTGTGTGADGDKAAESRRARAAALVAEELALWARVKERLRREFGRS